MRRSVLHRVEGRVHYGRGPWVRAAAATCDERSALHDADRIAQAAADAPRFAEVRVRLGRDVLEHIVTRTLPLPRRGREVLP